MKPLFNLLKKNATFEWTEETNTAFEDIKEALSSAPVLSAPDYEDLEIKPLFVTVDASPTGYGAVLQQAQPDGTRKVCRYISHAFNKTELSYSQVKKELYAIKCCLKKLRMYISGIDFTVETDCLPVCQLIRNPDSLDLIFTRWIAYVLSFNPKVVHIPGKENVVADALSRRPPNCLSIKIQEPLSLYGLIQKYIEGDNLDYLPPMEGKKIRQIAQQFIVREGALFKVDRHKTMPRRVILDLTEQEAILKHLHEGSPGGHRGITATYNKVALLYFWPKMFDSVKLHCSTCDTCQRRDLTRPQEPLHPTWSHYAWKKVHIDLVSVTPSHSGFKYIIAARDDLTGWIEGKALKNKTAQDWISFIEKNIIFRYGPPEVIVSDNGEMNSHIAFEFCARHGIQLKLTSDYHPQSNSLVERGHKPVVDALMKFCKKDPKKWPRFLDSVLWADRITVKRTTGYSPFFLLYGYHCPLPVERFIKSFRMIDWNAITTTEELLAARMTQLHLKDEISDEAADKLLLERWKNKLYFDEKRNIRKTPLQIGDLVLVFDSVNFEPPKVKPKAMMPWLGPYRIHSVGSSGFYYLEELDGTLIERPYAGNRLKRYYSRLDPEVIGLEVETTSNDTFNHE